MAASTLIGVQWSFRVNAGGMAVASEQGIVQLVGLFG
jgi:hypothetical protein